MPSTQFRQYLVIAAGTLMGVSLLVSTLRSLRHPSTKESLRHHLHPVDALARLVLGASLVLLALFLLAGRTLWTATSASAPSWATPVGAVLLGACLLAGAVAGGFALAGRLRRGRG